MKNFIMSLFGFKSVVKSSVSWNRCPLCNVLEGCSVGCPWCEACTKARMGEPVFVSFIADPIVRVIENWDLGVFRKDETLAPEQEVVVEWSEPVEPSFEDTWSAWDREVFDTLPDEEARKFSKIR